jgi:glutamate N-acetyltransferase/amino-acid N-acetyltransferase
LGGTANAASGKSTRLVRGFRFAGVKAGIKKKEGFDLGLIVARAPAAAAAVFTQNRVAAAPVLVSKKHLKKSKGFIRGVVVNSGNANACTGKKGLDDARQMTEVAAEALGAKPQELLVSSTGVIGHRLPMEMVEPGIRAAVKRLAPSRFEDFAKAILTTDRSMKIAWRSQLLGCTKGAGMIAPNMATTLTFVVTDAPFSPKELDRALRQACDDTYNAITVDGDTSTNDMILLMSSGAGPAMDKKRFTRELTALLDRLALKLMREGEGVHHVVTLRVIGASSTSDAKRVAKTIANSPLVKTAIAGQDPNWGRVLAAAGRSGVDLDPARLELKIGDVLVAKQGSALASRSWEKKAHQVMSRPAYELVLDLRQGRKEAHVRFCDLSHEYVSINADYRS